YIPGTGRLSKEGSSDAQDALPAGEPGRSRVRAVGGRGKLAAPLIHPGEGGSGGPPPPAPSPSARPGATAPMEDAFMDLSPGERRIFRLGGSVIRAWTDRPDAGAELYRSGEWVWTPIPSGAILSNPHAVEISSDELLQDRPAGGHTSSRTRRPRLAGSRARPRYAAARRPVGPGAVPRGSRRARGSTTGSPPDPR